MTIASTSTVQRISPHTVAGCPQGKNEDAGKIVRLSFIPPSALAFLSLPWVDKTVALMVSVPAIWVAYGCFKAGLMDIPRALFFAQAALYVLTMLMRRNPVRISANPWFWLVTFIETYYNLFTAGLLRSGVRVAPAQFINGVAVLGIWVVIFARLSLGRNIGLLPAQRQIVTAGTYRYVRHPIYSAYFFGALSLALSCCSLTNLLIIGFGCLMFVIKTLMEESFLSEDPDYAAYMKRVRWRWFPGLL